MVTETEITGAKILAQQIYHSPICEVAGEFSLHRKVIALRQKFGVTAANGYCVPGVFINI